MRTNDLNSKPKKIRDGKNVAPTKSTVPRQSQIVFAKQIISGRNISNIARPCWAKTIARAEQNPTSPKPTTSNIKRVRAHGARGENENKFGKSARRIRHKEHFENPRPPENFKRMGTTRPGDPLAATFGTL